MPTRDKDDKQAVEHSAAGDVTDNQAVSEHRRKLIKASAAVVPAIMTVRSGAAVALACANLCLAKDARRLAEDPPALVLSEQEPLDEFIYVNGVKVVKANTGGPGSTIYYCVEKTPGNWECCDEKGFPAANTIGIGEIKNGEKVKLLGYFNGDTFTQYPKNLVVSDQMATPISCSCLCSLHPEMDICKFG